MPHLHAFSLGANAQLRVLLHASLDDLSQAGESCREVTLAVLAHGHGICQLRRGPGSCGGRRKLLRRRCMLPLLVEQAAEVGGGGGVGARKRCLQGGAAAAQVAGPVPDGGLQLADLLH
jgi:hypothetical protein